ncbi:hypothetical protein Tco_1303141 [Tanacetum coccineum]
MGFSYLRESRSLGGETFLGREMEDLENFDSVIMGLSLQDGVDGWTWSLDTSGSFKVSTLRSCIDSLDLSRSDPVTLWNELIPKKVGGDVEELGTELERLGLKGDACKQLRKEVGASLRCLDCMVKV